MRPKKRILPLALTVTMLAGCASSNWNAPADCALIGAGVGVLGGMVYASTATDRNAEDYGIGIGVGLAGGALLGWGWCALMDYSGRRAAAPSRVKTAQTGQATPAATEDAAEPGAQLAGSTVMPTPLASMQPPTYSLAASK